MDVLRDLVSWRKGRDSNSRYPIGYAAFPGRYIKPLCHPSSGSSFIRSGVGLSRQPERRLCQRRDCAFYRSCFFFARAFATQKLPDSPFDRSQVSINRPAGARASRVALKFTRELKIKRIGSNKKGRCLGQKKLAKSVMSDALKKSMKSAPTSGTIMKETGEGPNFFVMACMLATALGVAPIPKPQNPALIVAAS